MLCFGGTDVRCRVGHAANCDDLSVMTPSYFRLLVLAACVTGLPASAQDAVQDTTLALVYQAYGEVLAGFAIESEFVSTYTTPDTTFVESGLAITHIDPETEIARFRLDFDEGETTIATLNEETYQVEFPRTEEVYVDSTREELYSGVASVLTLHPAFSTNFFYFASSAERTLIGPDAVNGAPCMRAEYTTGADTTAFIVSVCFDDAIHVPTEIRTLTADSVASTTVFRGFQAVEVPGPEAFEIPLRDGFERVPYNQDNPPLAVGQMAPDFALPDETGALTRLSDYRGRYVLIDFWGTWCAPCVEAIPHLADLEETYPELVILGLASYQYDNDDPTGFVRARGGDYAIVIADDATVDTYQVQAFPTYYLVDPDGTILFAAIPDREPDAENRLDALLEELFSD